MSKIPQALVQVNTRQYLNSHAKEPRGHGVWLFRIGGEIYRFNGTYTETKKLAIKAAASEGFDRVVVCP